MLANFRSAALGLATLCAAVVFTAHAQIHTSPNDGPGLGNLAYTEAEVCRIVSPAFPATSTPSGRQGWGNVDMINGYLWFHMETDGGGNANNGAFEFWDVSDPRNPQRVARHDTPDTRRGRENHGFGTSSSYPGDYLVMQAHTGLLFWDMTDPLNVRMLSALALPGISAGDYSGAWWSFWQAPYVFVAGQGQGLYVVDATDPANPVLVRRMLTSQTGGFNVGFVQAVGNLLFAAGVQSNGRFMSTFDISDPVNPRLLNSYNWGTTRNGYSHMVAGGKIYTAGGDGGEVQLRQYNLSHDGVITPAESAVPLPGTGNHENGGYLSLHSGHVFAGFSNRIAKVRINPTLQTVCQVTSGLPGDDEDFAVALGNIVFAGDDHGIGSHLVAHQAEPDTIGPEVEWMHPADGTANAALTSRVGVTMSEIFDLDSVTSDSFLVRPAGGGAAIPGKYSKQHHILNFSPDQPLQPFTTYEVVIQGIKDHLGNPGGVFTATFSTGALPVPPAAQNPTYADGTAGQSGVFTAAAPLYIDRPSGSSPQVFVANPYPAAFEGRLYVMTRNGDKQSTAPNAVNFSLNLDANVYVLFDTNRVPLPAWLSDGSWTPTGETVNTTDSSAPRHVYAKGFGIGNVSLGGNSAPSGSSSMYSVVVVPLEQSVPSCQIVAPGPVPVGSPAGFSATSTGNSVTYSWNFGDGSPETARTPSPAASHVYTQPGRYSVILEVLNSAGRGSCALTQVVHRPLTSQPPVHSATLVSSGSVAYAVNADSDTVSAVDGVSLQKLWEVPVGRHPRTLALAPDGDLWVVNQDDATISVVDRAGGFVRTTHVLRRASQPYGIAFGADGKAYVTLQATGELVRLGAGGMVEGTVEVGHKPRGIAISGDGERIFVTQFVSTELVGRVREVDAAGFSVVRTFELAFDPGPDSSVSGRGVPNYLTGLVISPDGQTLVVPSKKDNLARGMFRDGQMLNFETMTRAIVSSVDLVANQENPVARIDIDDRSMPQAAIFSPVGDLMLVSTQGTNTVEVFDAYNRGVRTFLDTGLAPQGLALSADGSRLFVHDFMGRSVSVYDVRDLIAARSNAAALLARVDTVTQEKLTAQQLLGKRIFYNSGDPRMARDRYISCSACHLDGGSDQQVWDFHQVGEGFRNTISLIGKGGMGHGRVHWTANFDEIQDFENDIRHFAGGTGFLSDADFAATADPLGVPKAGRSAELDALAAFVASLDKNPASPYRDTDGSLTAEGVHGRNVFIAQGCASCHSGARLTDGRRWDVGTIQPHSGLGIGVPLAGAGFDTPTLLNVWSTGPYLHDGSARTLRDVLGNPQHVGSLSDAEKDRLVAYLQQIDRAETATTVPPGTNLNRNVTLQSGESLVLGAGAVLNGNLTGAPSSEFAVGDAARVNGNVRKVTQVFYGAGSYQNGNLTEIGTVTALAQAAVTINGNAQASALALGPGARVVLNGNLKVGSVTLAAGARLEVNGNVECAAATKGDGATVVVRGNKKCPGL